MSISLNLLQPFSFNNKPICPRLAHIPTFLKLSHSKSLEIKQLLLPSTLLPNGTLQNPSPNSINFGIIPLVNTQLQQFMRLYSGETTTGHPVIHLDIAFSKYDLPMLLVVAVSVKAMLFKSNHLEIKLIKKQSGSIS